MSKIRALSTKELNFLAETNNATDCMTRKASEFLAKIYNKSPEDQHELIIEWFTAQPLDDRLSLLRSHLMKRTDLQDAIVEDEDAKVRIALSGLNLSGLVQEKLARDPNPAVRKAFAANVFLTEKVQGILLQDDEGVLRALQSNQYVTEQTRATAKALVFDMTMLSLEK